MSILVLPLEGVLVQLDVPDDAYRRYIASEVLLATALLRRTGKPVRRPTKFAQKVVANCLADLAAGGNKHNARVVAMKRNAITTAEMSRAADWLPLNVVCDLLFHGQVRREQGVACHLDYRDLIHPTSRRFVGDALRELLGLDHQPDSECPCSACRAAAAGEWEALFEWQEINPSVARELYLQAVQLGYPELERPASRSVPWQSPVETLETEQRRCLRDPDEF